MNANPNLSKFITPLDVLKDYSNGVGKTSDKDFSGIEVTKDSINGVVIPEVIARAHFFRAWYDGGKKQEFLTYASAGYMGKMHAAQFEEGKETSPVEVLPGHVLTADGFKDSFFGKAAKKEVVSSVYSALEGIKKEDSKEKILSVVKAVMELIISTEGLAEIAELREKEKVTQGLLNAVRGFFISGETEKPFILRERVVTGKLRDAESAKALAQYAREHNIKAIGKVADIGDSGGLVFGSPVSQDDPFADSWTGRSATIGIPVVLDTAKPVTSESATK